MSKFGILHELAAALGKGCEMTKLHTEQANTICRYLVKEDYGSGYSIVDSSWEKRELAMKQAASNKAWRPHARISVFKYVLHPNKTILDFGIERFDSMIKDVDESGLTLVGTRSELVDSGVIGDYAFDGLGKSGSRSACDEFGNKYRLRKKWKTRFELRFQIRSEPVKPYGMAKVDPYETDIAEIYDRIGFSKTNRQVVDDPAEYGQQES